MALTIVVGLEHISALTKFWTVVTVADKNEMHDVQPQQLNYAKAFIVNKTRKSLC